MTDLNKNKDRRAVIVCSHVAAGAPIIKAVRDAPEVDEDSGWQFLCGGSSEEDPGKAQVWLVREVVEKEPSLAPYIDLSPKIVLTRKSPDDEWDIDHK